MFSEMTESVDRELHKPILLERDKYNRWYGDITYISRMHVATSRVINRINHTMLLRPIYV
ncbi:hypothetical protein CY34DRAFT_803921 [Suillus luteus UH-Slu-Lm8-n1]|uniref:Uncharacterized protein n=1 Tax=Suillus luteus UH-Slu-Lm8-n1 TaxID=930992 RepID=A0A0D0A0B2_9AGAM|nr:hypothetical protein CY34DRAFT_803921 [Suillus luteus UH-Slu-Lm8-n1]